MPDLLGCFTNRRGRALRVPEMVSGVDRSRKVRLRRTARKPAPMLVPDRLTVKVTVKVCEAAVSILRINSLDGSLIIEWE